MNTPKITLRKNSLLHFIIILIICFYACEEGTGPGDDPPEDKDTTEVPKTPREYKWTVDTIKADNIFQIILTNIWGTSPDNVYAMGHSSNSRYSLWHFNGVEWNNIDLKIQPWTIYDIFGMDENNLWAVGEIRNYLFKSDSSLVVKNNGTGWSEILPRNTSDKLTSVGGNSENNIYFGGLNGILRHWDGQSITKDSLPINLPKIDKYFHNIRSITKSKNNKIFLLLAKGDTVKQDWDRYLFERSNNNWINKGQMPDDSKKIWLSPTGKLYCCAYKDVFSYENGSWVSTGLDQDVLLMGVNGTSDENIFAVGWKYVDYKINAGIYHYNGTDWHFYNELELADVHINGVIVFDKEVFIVGYYDEGGATYSLVLHGK